MMPARKTETLTIRLCPETKAALRQAAEQEHRSLSNMLEMMIRVYRCRQPSIGSNRSDMTDDESCR